MIELGKKYQTRDGRAVRILCTDLKGCGAATVIGLVTQGSGTEYVESWMADGRTVQGWGGDKDSDLCPVPTKHEGWMAIVRSGNDKYWVNGRVWDSRAEAIANTVGGGVSISHVTWES